MRHERPFVVERAVVVGRRYHAQPDDRAELEAIWRALRDIPRENLASTVLSFVTLAAVQFGLRRLARK